MTGTGTLRDTVSGQLRWYLEHGGQSTYQLERETGVSNAALSRFLRQDRGLSLETVDKLAKHLRLRLVPDES